MKKMIKKTTKLTGDRWTLLRTIKARKRPVEAEGQVAVMQWGYSKK